MKHRAPIAGLISLILASSSFAQTVGAVAAPNFPGGVPAPVIPGAPALGGGFSMPLPSTFALTPTITPALSVSGSAAPRAASINPSMAAPRRARRLKEDAATAAVSNPRSAPRALRTLFDGSSDADEESPVAPGVPFNWVQQMIGQSAASNTKLQDAVRRKGFAKAAVNSEVLKKHNNRYTVELPVGPVMNQEGTEQCWVYAGQNVLRSMLIAAGKVPKNFEFSHTYLHFFNMLEKANHQLETAAVRIYKRGRKSETATSRRKALVPRMEDNGEYAYFAFLVSKYGLVPKSAMKNTVSSEKTALLNEELNARLALVEAEMMANARRHKAGRAPDLAMEILERGRSRIWNILAAHLGIPPTQFAYRPNPSKRPRTFTPRKFAQKFVGFDPNDYVLVASFPGKKTGTTYEIKDSAIGASSPGRPRSNVRFLQVALERLEVLAVAAIAGGQPVYFAADHYNDIHLESGIMHPEIYNRAALYQSADEGRLSRAEAFYLGRLRTRHAMALTGFDRPDNDKPVVKFKVENSWGADVGSRGVFHLYREWFHRNVLEILVHRRFLSRPERKSWNNAIQVKNPELG